MENNEDEPQDVRKATPVASSILDGSKDERNQNIRGTKPKSAPVILSDRDEPTKKRCNLYRTKLPPSSGMKKKKPCHQKPEIICRDNLSKNEYIDMLATPKENRGLTCNQPKSESNVSPSKRSSSNRKLSCKEKAAQPRPISRRMEDLAKPKQICMMELLRNWGSKLRPEVIEAVQKSLEENCVMSPEQMEAYYNEKDSENCDHARRYRRKKCPGRKEKKKSSCDDHMDPTAVCEEYEMAQRFMRHIISHVKESPFAPEDHYDLTETILYQLGRLLDYSPSGDGDRKFQMMFLLANGIACWVHGLNVAVTEKLAKERAKYGKETMERDESEDEDIEEVKEQIKAEMEDEEEEEEGEEAAEGDEEEAEELDEEEEGELEYEGEAIEEEVAVEDFENEDNEPIEDDESEEMKNEITPKIENTGASHGETELVETDEDTDVELKAEEDQMEVEPDTELEEEPKIQDEDDELGTELELDESERDEQFDGEIEGDEETDVGEEVEEEPETADEDTKSIQLTEEPAIAIQGLGEGDLFASEIPFLTFGKIMEIVLKFLNKFEKAETTDVRRRLQNAVLKKLTALVLAEAPDSLDSNMKSVLEVLAENIAVFMEEALPESRINEIRSMAPEVESTDVRNWGHWLEKVMDNATSWGKWIHQKVDEAEEKALTKVSRGDWQDWSTTMNSEALQWRMFNLDTKHRMHHADLSLTHKKVVHRGGQRTGNGTRSATLAPYPEKDETEINAYDLSDEAQNPDQNLEAVEIQESEN